MVGESISSSSIKLEKYRYHRGMMKSGDLVEFGTTSVLAKTIRLFTRKDVNHTALIIRSLILSDRVFLLEALSKGLTPNFLSDRILDTDGDVFWLPLKDEVSDDLRLEMARWAIQEYVVKKPKYDYRGLIGNAFSRVSVEVSRYFCSEFAFKTWGEVGIVKIDENTKSPRPGEFEILGKTKPRVRLR